VAARHSLPPPGEAARPLRLGPSPAEPGGRWDTRWASTTCLLTHLSITDTPDAPSALPDSSATQAEAGDSPSPDGVTAPAVEATASPDAADPAEVVEAAEPAAEADGAPDAAADGGPDAADDPHAATDEPPARATKKPAARARRPAGAPANGRDRRTTAQRLGNFPRADRPAEIPAPEHHHLPGWVRRDFARARPPLSNILALLEGEPREQFAAKIDELTKGISAGRFSLAWQYPDLVDEGRTLYEKQRRETADSARANRQLDTARRRVQDRIRDAADQLSPEVSARLQRQLRSASDSESISAVAQELDGVATAAKSTAEKRREREIERTRARIRRTAAGAGTAAAAPQEETWQDVLRRFAEQQAAGSRGSE